MKLTFNKSLNLTQMILIKIIGATSEIHDFSFSNGIFPMQTAEHQVSLSGC